MGFGYLIIIPSRRLPHKLPEGMIVFSVYAFGASVAVIATGWALL
jgi:zinc transporter ZupT